MRGWEYEVSLLYTEFLQYSHPLLSQDLESFIIFGGHYSKYLGPFSIIVSVLRSPRQPFLRPFIKYVLNFRISDLANYGGHSRLSNMVP